MTSSLTWSSLSVLSQTMNSDLKYKNQKKEKKKKKKEQKNSSLVICLGTECFSLNKERKDYCRHFFLIQMSDYNYLGDAFSTILNNNIFSFFFSQMHPTQGSSVQPQLSLTLRLQTRLARNTKIHLSLFPRCWN